MLSFLNGDAEGIVLWQTHVPEEIIFCIYSFLYRNEIRDVISHSERDLQASRYFRVLSKVSKAFNNSIHNYFRKIPMVLKISGRGKESLKKIGWICRNKVMVKHCNFYVRGENEAALCTYILSSCNWTELESCSLHLIKGNRDIEESDMYEAGIPAYVIQLKGANETEKFRNIFNEELPKRAPSLKKFSLILKESISSSLLLVEGFSFSLQSLEITMFAPDYSPPSSVNMELLALSQMIERLSTLKRLKIQSMFEAKLSLRSKSLEMIDTTGSRGLYIDECICNSLQSFICNHKRGCSKNWSNGIKPFEEELFQDLYQEGTRSSVKETIEIRAKAHPFLGLVAPDECTVKIKI